MKHDWFHIAILAWTVLVTVGGFAIILNIATTP